MLCLQLGNNHVCLTSTSLMHKKKIVHKTSMASTKLKDLIFQYSEKYRYDYIDFSGHFLNTTATKMAQWVRVNLGYGQVVTGLPFCVSNTPNFWYLAMILWTTTDLMISLISFFCNQTLSMLCCLHKSSDNWIIF